MLGDALNDRQSGADAAADVDTGEDTGEDGEQREAAAASPVETGVPAVWEHLARQVAATLGPEGEATKHDPRARAAALRLFRRLQPRDEKESMLLAQMVAVHMAAMACFERAHLDLRMTESGKPLRPLTDDLGDGLHLAHVYARQLDALRRWRAGCAPAGAQEADGD